MNRRPARLTLLALGIALPTVLLGAGWSTGSLRERAMQAAAQRQRLQRSASAIRAAVDESLEDLRRRENARPFYLYNHYYSPPELLALNDPIAVSPLASGRLDPPDICLIYATPGQMIILINGLQWTGYRKFDWGVVGESACADSWGRALATGEPSLSLPCFAERRYGGVPDEEMLMALKPGHLAQAVAGMEALARNGLRYPIPPYGIQTDARAGLGASYS